jgi:restriction system protein
MWSDMAPYCSVRTRSSSRSCGVARSIWYGTNRSELQHTGGSRDASTDGIISLDKLGLEKVYVQAKRWQHTVGRRDLQAFFGALAGRKANKGVFVTTSSFSKDAAQYAAQVSGGLVLVDGAKLVELMIEHGVGVSYTPVRIARVDSDYFEEA